jgi:hypothetical protein
LLSLASKSVQPFLDTCHLLLQPLDFISELPVLADLRQPSEIDSKIRLESLNDLQPEQRFDRLPQGLLIRCLLRKLLNFLSIEEEELCYSLRDHVAKEVRPMLGSDLIKRLLVARNLKMFDKLMTAASFP